MRSFQVAFAVLCFTKFVVAHKWSYTDQAAWIGSDNAIKYNWTCDGMRQSPINIVTSNAVHDRDIDEGFVFAEDLGNNIAHAYYTNKGHTMQMTDAAYETSSMTISGADLPKDDYAFWQFHFHWGTANAPGAEHTINGMRYPAEVHFVFKSKSTELTEPDSLAVLGFFIDTYDGSNFVHGGQWKHIIDAIADLSSTEGATEYFNDSLSISDLIPIYQPDVIQRVFHYDGSLTNPPCYEVVNWYVFEQPIYLSRDQYDKFLAVKNSHDRLARSTYRIIQPLNGRTVYKTEMAGGRWLISVGAPIGRLSISATAVMLFAWLI